MSTLWRGFTTHCRAMVWMLTTYDGVTLNPFTDVSIFLYRPWPPLSECQLLSLVPDESLEVPAF
jgi:hypothetical protein